MQHALQTDTLTIRIFRGGAGLPAVSRCHFFARGVRDMGLFDFFKRKRGKREEPVPPDAASADLPETPTRLREERPHSHHYIFAHVALRQVAFENPLSCLGLLGSPDAMKFITGLWASVDSHCRERGETSTINPAEIVVHRLRIGNYPCAVVEMPEPWFMTGAYFVALVLAVPLAEVDPDLKDPPLLYYTLEKGASLDGGEPTVLCSWTKDIHSNYGSGPEPTLEAFVRAVTDMVEKAARA